MPPSGRNSCFIVQLEAASMKLLLFLAFFAYTPLIADDTTSIGTMLTRSVVVSSTRTTNETPVTKTVIDSVTIARAMAGQDAEFLLERTSPSIVAYSESGTGVSNNGLFRLRGIDQTRVNITLNGAPLNDMIDQGVFFYNITDLLNGMKSVQIQRGVGITGNGTASFAGSVSIESPLPLSIRPAARLQLTTGSYGFLRGSAEASTGAILPGLSASVKLSSLSSDGYRYNTGTTGNSGMVGLSYIQGSNMFRLLAVGGRTQNQLGYLPVPKNMADIDPRTNLDDSTDHEDFGQYLLQAEWTHVLTQQAAFSVMTYAGGAGGDYFAGFRDTTGMLTQINYPLKNRNYGLLGNLSIDEMANGLDLDFGIHAYTFNRRNWETVSPESTQPYYADTTTKHELSAFAKAMWTLGEETDYPHARLQFEVQNRYVAMRFSPDGAAQALGTTIPIRTWNFVNAKAGVSWVVSPEQNLYASVGRTGREPTRFDFLGGTQITEANISSLVGPTAVQPEYVLDFEAGWNVHTPLFGDTDELTLCLNGFYMDFTNEIAPVGQYIEQYFVQLRTNVASSKRYGIETDLRYAANKHFVVHGSLTLMTSNVDKVYLATADTTVTNVAAVLTPSVISTLQAEWSPLSWLAISAGLRTVSSSFLELTNNSSLMLNGFALFNTALQLNYNQFSVRLTVNNLTDVRYFTNGGVDYTGGIAVPAVFMQAGRNVWVMFDASL